MSDVLAPVPPPAAYANPWAAGAITMDLICEGVRGLRWWARRRREIRRLDRIDVLPLGWDAAGRHHVDR